MQEFAVTSCERAAAGLEDPAWTLACEHLDLGTCGTQITLSPLAKLARTPHMLRTVGIV